MNMRRITADWTNGRASGYQYRYSARGLPSYDGSTYKSSVNGGYFTQWNITSYGLTWYNSPLLNHGMLLWSNNAPYQTFASSDYLGSYPKLTWYYNGYGAAWAFWNITSYGDPNCFGYALGISVTPPLVMNQGDSVTTVANRVISYVQNTLGRSIRTISGPTANIAHNEYRFCMRVGNHSTYPLEYRHDYHFWVQTNTGAWAEKNGKCKVFHTPVNVDPSTASWDMPSVDSLGNRTGTLYANYYDSATIYFAATR
jgi:hypothetical protein